MTPATPRPRRAGWPWPAARRPALPDDDALHDSQALVNATAFEVAQLTEQLHLALGRLEQAQLEARVASECVAAREAVQAIARAQRVD